jgi:hypothetical protein
MNPPVGDMVDDGPDDSMQIETNDLIDDTLGAEHEEHPEDRLDGILEDPYTPDNFEDEFRQTTPSDPTPIPLEASPQLPLDILPTMDFLLGRTGTEFPLNPETVTWQNGNITGLPFIASDKGDNPVSYRNRCCLM